MFSPAILTIWTEVGRGHGPLRLVCPHPVAELRLRADSQLRLLRWLGSGDPAPDLAEPEVPWCDLTLGGALNQLGSGSSKDSAGPVLSASPLLSLLAPAATCRATAPPFPGTPERDFTPA